MADRYLIGTGARNWNDTANWSTISGGSGGASVPTSVDNVLIDNNSGTGTITVNAIANMLDLTFGTISSITLSNAAYAFNVYGNLTLPASNLTVSFTGTGYLYLKSTSPGKTITTNGNTSGWNRLYFDGVGGEWTLLDNWKTNTPTVYFVNGHVNINNYIFDTNKNGITFSAGTKTITLGSGTIKSRYLNGTAANLTWNYDIGTVDIDTYIYEGSLSISLTFYNLIIRTSILVANEGFDTFKIAANIIVTNSLSFIGFNSNSGRLLVTSNTIGTPRTITCNGSIVASNVDFRDITLAGTANRDLSAITGGSGDCGGNSGITFTPAQPQYYKHTSGACTWKDSRKWFSDATPRTTAGRVPLPQDDATFDENSFTGTSTLTIDCPRIGRTLDMSAVNQSLSFSWTGMVHAIHGSYVLGPNVVSGTIVDRKELHGRGNFIINTYGKTTRDIAIYAYNGTYTVMSDLNYEGLSTSTLPVYGVLDYNNFNVTAGVPIQMQQGGSPVVYMRSGIFTGISNDPIYAPHGTLYFNDSTFISLPANGSQNVTIRGYNFNKLRLSGTHTGYFDFTGSCTIGELILDPGRKVRFTAGTTQNIAKATIGAGATIGSITNATHTLNYTGSDIVETDGITVSYSNATPANKWYVGANSTNGGNNSGWLFESLKRITASLTQEELLQASPFSDVLFHNELNEGEQLNTEVQADTIINAEFREIESKQTNFSTEISVPIECTEAEEINTQMIDLCYFIFEVTEQEEIEAILLWVCQASFDYEVISGKSNFNKNISGKSNFSKLISGKSNYK